MDFKFRIRTFIVFVVILSGSTSYSFDEDYEDVGYFNRCPWIRNKLKNGRVRIRSRGRIAKFICDPGYELAGKRFATCVRGQWNNPIPVCVTRGCNRIRQPANGRSTETHKGAFLTFDCNPGYTLYGPSNIFCDGRRWSAQPPDCNVADRDPELSCDFEERDLCGWSQDPAHDFDWKRSQFQTPSGLVGTGPSYDHTYGDQKGGFYIYLEASAPHKVNDTTRLFSPVYGADKSGGCFSFWYHMYGENMGALKIYLKPESQLIGELRPVWEKLGNQGNLWSRGNISVPLLHENFQIIIEGVRGNGYAGDAAVDDVRLSTANCESMENETDVTAFTSGESCRGRCRELSEEPACGCDESCYTNENCCSDYTSICLGGNETVAENPEEHPAEEDDYGKTSSLVTITASNSTTEVVTNPDKLLPTAHNGEFNSTENNNEDGLKTSSSTATGIAILSTLGTTRTTNITSSGSSTILTTFNQASTYTSSSLSTLGTENTFRPTMNIPVSSLSTLRPINASSTSQPRTASSAPEPGTTSSKSQPRTTPSTPQIRTTSSAPQPRTTSSAPQPGTTPSIPQTRTTSSTPQSTITSTLQARTSSSTPSESSTVSSTHSVVQTSLAAITSFNSTIVLTTYLSTSTNSNTRTSINVSTSSISTVTNLHSVKPTVLPLNNTTVTDSDVPVISAITTGKQMQETTVNNTPTSSDQTITSTSSTRRKYNLRPRPRTTIGPSTSQHERYTTRYRTNDYISTLKTTFSYPRTSTSATPMHVPKSSMESKRSTSRLPYAYSGTTTSSFRFSIRPTYSEPTYDHHITYQHNHEYNTAESTLHRESKRLTSPTKAAISASSPSKSASDPSSDKPVATIVSLTIACIICFAGALFYFLKRQKNKRQSKLSDDSELRFLPASEEMEYSDASSLDQILVK